MIRLLFDENFGKPIVAAFARLVAFWDGSIEAIQLIDHCQKIGVKDEDWIPPLRDDPDWVVITGDRGRGKGSKLPRVCAANDITHVLLSPAVHNRKQFEKCRAVLYVWDSITNLDVGCRYALQANNTGYRLLKKPI